MADDDRGGRCGYCAKPTERPFLWDVFACSEGCEQALSDLLDGVPLKEVKAKFPGCKGEEGDG